MRKCMAKEFSSIYIWHLKGNARTVGEQRRKEKDNVFGVGSRAPVAIVILVKNPEHKGECKIHFAAVGDYLTREEKLKQTADAKGIYGIQFRTIVPDAHGDWLSQRDDSFERFIPISSSVFKDCAIGVSTNRDFWVYGSSIKSIESNVNRTFDSYARSLTFFKNTGDLQYATSIVNSDISWSAGLKRKLEKKEEIASFSKTKLTKSMYRPYFVQNLYYERDGIIERPGRWNSIIINSTPSECNYVICVTGVGAKSFCCLMVDKIPCLDFVEKTQCFPRYLYEQQASAKATESTSLFEAPSSENEVAGYKRKDAITSEALKHFQDAYPGESVTTDAIFYYIYGILHSEEYRTRYANNLMKELPRIPRVATYEAFKKFEEAGRKLAELHVNFEQVEEYKAVKVNIDKREGWSYYVTQMKYGKIPGKTGNAAKDKTKLVYNDFIMIEGIPLKAQEYVVNKRSALDWIVERACVKVDKDSGIVNDFNDFAAEKGDPRYPLSLFLKVLTVSLETMKIVKGLPKLDIHQLDKQP